MMKKLALILLVMGVFSGMAASGSSAAETGKKIRVVSQMLGTPAQQQFFAEKIIPEFEAETGIDVDFVNVQSPSDLFKYVEVQSLSGKWDTDVFIAHDSAAPILIDRYDAIEPFDKLPAGTYVNTFDYNFTKDGKRYFVPLQADVYFLIANKKALPALTKLGYDINHLTWTQFAQWVNALKQETGSPKYVYPSLAGLYCLYQTNAIQLACGCKQVPVFNTPESQKAFDILSSMKDAILPSSPTIDYPLASLQSGEAWVSVYLMEYAVEVYSQAPDQFVVVPAPTGEDGAVGTIVGGHGIGIAKHSKNKAAAQAFVDFILRDDILSKIMQLGPYIPCKEELIKTLGDTPSERVMKMGTAMLAGKTRVDRVRVDEYTDYGLVKKLYEDTFGDILAGKTIDKAYLDQKQAALDSLKLKK